MSAASDAMADRLRPLLAGTPDIVEKKMISDGNRQNLVKALDAFTQSWQA